jgi:CBS domain-containing protein
MSAPAVTVQPGTSLTGAAKVMDDERVKRLPVVDERDRLLGIVSRADLLRVFARPDPEIAGDVVDEVLGRTLWVDPGRVQVTVRDGVVTLDGQADRRSTADLAVKLTQGVPGVVEVVDRLGFDFDDRELVEARRFGPGPFGMP